MTTYQGYVPCDGKHCSALDVAVAFQEARGYQPSEIEWANWLWLAGPIETKPAAPVPASTETAAAPSVGTNEQPLESVTLSGEEGQGQWTQTSLI